MIKIHTQHGSFEVEGPLLISLPDGQQVKLSESMDGIRVQNMTVHPAQLVDEGQILFGKHNSINMRRHDRLVRL